jgi:hypothetical protein
MDRQLKMDTRDLSTFLQHVNQINVEHRSSLMNMFSGLSEGKIRKIETVAMAMANEEENGIFGFDIKDKLRTQLKTGKYSEYYKRALEKVRNQKRDA